MAQYFKSPPAKLQGFEIWGLRMNKEGVLALSLVLLMGIVGALNPQFLSSRNLTNVFQSNAYIAVAAIGMSMANPTRMAASATLYRSNTCLRKAPPLSP